MMVWSRDWYTPQLYQPKNPGRVWSNPMGEIVCGEHGVCVLDAPDPVFVDDAVVRALAPYEQDWVAENHSPRTRLAGRRLRFAVSRREVVPEVMVILTGAGFEVEVVDREVCAWLIC